MLHTLKGHDPRDPLASPVLADFAGLPPLLIQVGAREILLDDAVNMARAAGLAGSEARLEIWPGMVHVWHLFAPQLDEATTAIDQAVPNKPSICAAEAVSPPRSSTISDGNTGTATPKASVSKTMETRMKPNAALDLRSPPLMRSTPALQNHSARRRGRSLTLTRPIRGNLTTISSSPPVARTYRFSVDRKTSR
ncbi:MAG: alpha/beta hydrolase [Alphaproteobacteria bacterium]|nr:alpha/beta hydrolase [Alphaproteobacteria bacterium]